MPGRPPAVREALKGSIRSALQADYEVGITGAFSPLPVEAEAVEAGDAPLPFVVVRTQGRSMGPAQGFRHQATGSSELPAVTECSPSHGCTPDRRAHHRNPPRTSTAARSSGPPWDCSWIPPPRVLLGTRSIPRQRRIMLTSPGGYLLPAYSIPSLKCASALAPEAGAQCGSPARWDLRGGPPVRAVPTAIPTSSGFLRPVGPSS